MNPTKRRTNLRKIVATNSFAVECGVGYITENKERAVLQVMVTDKTNDFANLLNIGGHSVTVVRPGTINVTFAN